MASRSSPALLDIATSIMVDIKDCSRLEFKKFPHIAKVDDSIDGFSSVPDGVLYVEDVRAYIHCTLEDMA